MNAQPGGERVLAEGEVLNLVVAGPDALDSPSATDPGPKEDAPDSQAASPLNELVLDAYSREGRKVVFAKKRLNELKLPGIGAEGSRVTLDPASFLEKDPDLLVPPRLLTALLESDAERQVVAPIRVWLMRVLAGHAVFSSEPEHLLGSETEDVSTVVQRLCGIAEKARMPKHLSKGPNASTAKKRWSDTLRRALTVALMNAAIRDRWVPADVAVGVVSLERALGALRRSDASAIASIVNASSDAGLGAVAAAIETARADVASARDDAERERDARILSDRQRDEAVRVQADLQDEIRSLSDQAQRRERQSLHERSHAIDEYEALRTRIVRMLGDQIELLGDGHHALRAGHAEVTDEFMDRSIAALTRELERLTAEAGG